MIPELGMLFSLAFVYSVVDLVEGNNVPALEAKIARYQKENAEQIMNAQARKVCKMVNGRNRCFFVILSFTKWLILLGHVG